jgi:predicted glutamine amidotransferase
MCRHFAYVGEQVTIKELLLDPPHGLVEQAWRPRRQRHGTMNVDGFGIGWYTDADPVPARYRRGGPIWADDCLPDLARVTRTRAMLGAVRSASVGTDPGSSAAAPYCDGRWLFSLNGALVGWSKAAGGSATGRRKRNRAPRLSQANGSSGPFGPGPSFAPAGEPDGAQYPGPAEPAESSGTAEPPGADEPAAEPVLAALALAQARAEAAGEPLTEPAPIAAVTSLSDAAGAVLRLAERVPAADLLGLQARCDSALLWAMVQIRLREGEGPTEALAGTIADVTEAGVTGRFNMLLTNGEVIAATAAGDTLCYRRDRTGVVVASEPSDDDPGWQDVPDGSVVEATPAAVVVRPLLLTSLQADRFAPVSTPNGATHPSREATSR